MYAMDPPTSINANPVADFPMFVPPPPYLSQHRNIAQYVIFV